jgi:hypothetical protein
MWLVLVDHADESLGFLKATMKLRRPFLERAVGAGSYSK